MACLEDKKVHEAVTRAVLKQFELLPRRARPDPGQWTNVAGLVMLNADADGGMDGVVKSAVCICLATGTKCLPADRWRDDGKAVTDCHAEVLCRRLFQVWLAREIEQEMGESQAADSEKNIGQLSKFIERVRDDEGLVHGQPVFKMRQGWRVCMYTSMSPCGDASILQTSDKETAAQQSPEEEEPEVDVHPPRKLSKILDKAVPGRTGARRIEQVVPDKLEADQTVGCLRLKPGRGTSCKSLSCSDKMAVWNVVGLQGWLLAPLLLHPVFLDLLVVDSAFFDASALKRALRDRMGEHCRNIGQVYASSTEGLSFPYGRATVPLKAAATNRSANWILGMGDEYLLGDLGRRDGIPAKRSWEDAYASRVSRWSFLKTAQRLATSVTAGRNAPCPEFDQNDRFCEVYKKLKAFYVGMATPDIKAELEEKSRLMASHFSSWREMKHSSSTADG